MHPARSKFPKFLENPLDFSHTNTRERREEKLYKEKLEIARNGNSFASWKPISPRLVAEEEEEEGEEHKAVSFPRNGTLERDLSSPKSYFDTMAILMNDAPAAELSNLCDIVRAG